MSERWTKARCERELKDTGKPDRRTDDGADQCNALLHGYDQS